MCIVFTCLFHLFFSCLFTRDLFYCMFMAYYYIKWEFFYIYFICFLCYFVLVTCDVRCYACVNGMKLDM
ncbi:hypothetical protein BDZ91DRAFT_719768 [Kalaharituber pfeilii]|nr:hypothetical protein BDZ91DRAFT_719768 [Kalaharituber pfeilii]